MKNLKHTKGEWKFNPKNFAIESQTEWTIEPNQKEGEEGVRKQVILCFVNMGVENIMSDIKLITASPIMLDSLIEARNALSMAINATPSGELRNKLCDANINVMAAIYKASEN